MKMTKEEVTAKALEIAGAEVAETVKAVFTGEYPVQSVTRTGGLRTMVIMVMTAEAAVTFRAAALEQPEEAEYLSGEASFLENEVTRMKAELGL